MTDAPPFDPPYFFVEKTEQGVRVVETSANGARQERMVEGEEAVRLLSDGTQRSTAASSVTRTLPKKAGRASSGMPAGSTLLAVPFAEKDAAKKLGARWNAERRVWYAPPGSDISLFRRWHTDDADA